MKNLRSYLIIALAMVLFIGACAGGGEVVKVSTTQKGAYAGVKKEDLAKLDEIKNAKGDSGIDSNLENIIEETPHFTVAEYLMQHPEVKNPAGGDYTVGGYDVLNIMVYEEEDLTRESVRISADGSISFPLIGRLKVDGLTSSEIGKEIALKLAEGEYLLNAHVSVMVTEYNSKQFLVLGSARNPGSYPLQANERILDGLSKAGGVRKEREGWAEPEGGGNRAMLIRTQNPNTMQEQKIVINIDLAGLLKGRDQISNIYLMDKDVLFIPSAEHFYIIGQVNKPGSYTIPDKEITLVEAISIAGGFTPIASRNKTRIIRVEDGIGKVIVVRVDAITEAGKKIEDVIIQADDVIVVPESFF